MKSLTILLKQVLADASTRLGVNTTRDWFTVERRVEHEGISFLTITLPSFGADFERSLANSQIDPTRFLSFKKHKSLPAFLQGLTGLVFDLSTGRLLDSPNEDAIYLIRQICYLLKKVKAECTDERNASAFRRFIQIENELELVGASGLPCDDTKYHLFGKVADIIWPSVLGHMEQKIVNYNLRPRHGPGATAQRISGNRKYVFSEWHSRLESYFPFDQYGTSTILYLDEVTQGLKFIDPGAETPVRVITVPKTLKTPRIIAIEPVCMQYIQQSLLREIVPSIESHRFTSGHVNFTDQKINQSLAMQASRDRSYATLDMSDASDRVHSAFVYRMLYCTPILRSAIFACRSTKADVPGYGVITLSKFASMGSALCFPIESMVFYTVVLSALHSAMGRRPTRSSIQELSRLVYVYGDDIVVPTDMARDVTRWLEDFHLRVNQSKSFSDGNFRESCGVDAFNGTQVTPVYCRQREPRDVTDVHEILSWVSMCNQLWFAGMWKTSDYVRRRVERIIGKLPLGRTTAGYLSLHSFQNTEEWSKIDENLHSRSIKAYSVRSTPRKSAINGYYALLKCFLESHGDGSLDKEHLVYAGRSASLKLKKRWSLT